MPKRQDDAEFEVKEIGIVVDPEKGPQGIAIRVGLKRPTGETPRAAGRIGFTGVGPGKWPNSPLNKPYVGPRVQLGPDGKPIKPKIA